MHISKPHWEGDLLIVNAINQTAGLFAGDAIHISATAEAGSSLLLTSPAAQRAHRMPEGEARVEQHFRVREGAWLEVWPELFIPQAGSRYRQRTVVEVEAGGELLLFETLAPGRVASGEAFLFESLEWEMDLFHAGAHAARERYRLRPEDGSIYALRRLFPAAYYASCFAIGTRFLEDEALWRDVAALHSRTLQAGCSRLSAGGWVVKLIASNAPELRRALFVLRRLFYDAAGRQEPSLRRF